MIAKKPSKPVADVTRKTARPVSSKVARNDDRLRARAVPSSDVEDADNLGLHAHSRTSDREQRTIFSSYRESEDSYGPAFEVVY